MFIHLHVHSQYSFLDGASSIETYLKKAAELEMPAIALTDHNNVSGAVEFYKQANELGIKPIQGVEITIEGGFHLTLLAENNRGYQSICKILTDAYRLSKNSPSVSWDTLASYKEGLIVLTGCRNSAICQALLRKNFERAKTELYRLLEIFGKKQVYLEMINTFLPRTTFLLDALYELHKYTDIPLVATNNVHYAVQENYTIHDLLTCVRTKTNVDDIHPERPLNSENYLTSIDEMQRRFKRYPQALETTLEIAERCEPALNLGKNLFPKFDLKDGSDSHSFLRNLVWQGAKKRYSKLTQPIINRLEHELRIIAKLDVADYFLAVWDIVQFAKTKQIRYAGRGSAADSAVAYCLEITNVDSIGRGLLFERFLSLERAQKPDIDIDFDARHRDEIAHYVYKKYRKDHVASVCTFSTFHARSALRDLAKALDYPQDVIEGLVKNIPGYTPADGIEDVLKRLPELKGHPLHSPRYKYLLTLCTAINGFPRHIGTHLGGLVISGEPLTNVTPLQLSAKGVYITQFDKRTIEDLGLIKLDLLSLRTLSAVKEVEPVLKQQGKSYDDIPLDDQDTYQMLNNASSVGVFQLESPAQRSLQARLHADNIEDIVASVALIRPGPIKADMVEPFITRRHGLETPTYLHPKLKSILAKTYGVVLYQEQVIEIATEIAGFTPGESDRLRRAMTNYRSQKELERIGEQFVTKAIANGIEPKVAKEIFAYILSYAGYGFCEAHAAAFSDTAYKTAYLIRHYPSYFFAALLNHQPMGFYPPNTLIVHARQRGIKILPLDILASEIDFTADENSIRIGLKQVRGITADELQSIIDERKIRPFSSLADFIKRTSVNKDVIDNLILAGAFDRFNNNRRSLVWQTATLIKNRKNSLFLEESDFSGIEDFSDWERWLNEYRVLQLSSSKHIMDFYRPYLEKQNVYTSKELQKATPMEGKRVTVAGLVIRPHRPPTRSGKTVVFLSLEDEYGLLDVTIFENVYRRFSKEIFNFPLLKVTGKLALQGKLATIIADYIQPLST
ncbi:MAG: DNA polymerase III subunit alpha [Firmicutes bacterium]|nr:DNA polymerase III subunit alpha [Bacillota bacterium]